MSPREHRMTRRARAASRSGRLGAAGGAGRLGQDRGADAALPEAAVHGRRPGRDSRHHLHAQGGRRDARARHPGAARAAPATPIPARRELRALAAAALAHGAARGWQLESEPQSLRIQTIDSFNYWLASQLPVASRVGGALAVTESADELYRRAARRTLLARRPTRRSPRTRSCCSSGSTITG